MISKNKSKIRYEDMDILGKVTYSISCGFMGLIGVVAIGAMIENEVPQRFLRNLTKPFEEIRVESMKPSRISIYDNKTEIAFIGSNYAGYVLIDRDNDGTVDDRVDYPIPFRGVTRMHPKVTEADQRRYDNSIGR